MGIIKHKSVTCGITLILLLLIGPSIGNIPRQTYAMAVGDVITQASPPEVDERSELNAVADLPEVVNLSMRGRIFEVKRDRILSLPECILFGLTSGIAANAFGTGEESDNDVLELDFDPDCFNYILTTIETVEDGIEPAHISDYKAPMRTSWQGSSDDIFSSQTRDENSEDDSDSMDTLTWLLMSSTNIPQILSERPSLIVLREDLEFYLLTKSKTSDESLSNLKDRIGDIIVAEPKNKKIFEGLRNNDILDSPEYHLMQMLVLAGVQPDSKWDFRNRKKRSSQILSLQMSRVKVPTDSTKVDEVSALRKLLLFWRKPAKKCWWDKLQIEGETVHIRRVWTLELSIVGLKL